MSKVQSILALNLKALIEKKRDFPGGAWEADRLHRSGSWYLAHGRQQGKISIA